ncbi:MAG: histidinol-phosphatase [Arenicellales bacterium WSBS_2016_MAG_OTU3]
MEQASQTHTGSVNQTLKTQHAAIAVDVCIAITDSRSTSSKANDVSYSTKELTRFLTFANDIADAARDITLQYFRQPFAIEQKQDKTPVTIADRETECLIRTRIRDRFPTHGILGEEFGFTGGEDGAIWVVDPIDGTKSFIGGRPLYSTLIALVVENKPVLGVVDFPALNERWTGAAGLPSLMNGKPITTRKTMKLAESSLYATSPDMFNRQEALVFEAISNAAGYRRFGDDAYAYALLASGYNDIVMESDLKVYDYLALVPVIEGAGGCISDWGGNRLTLESKSQVLACATQALHKSVLKQIQLA